MSKLFENVNDELKKISLWFKLNKLSLNIKKTNFILFGQKNKIINISNLNIKIDDVIIEQVENTKFLGVVINSTLTWQDHIKTVCKKVSKNVGILLRMRKTIPGDILLTLYYTLIEPYFSYCNIVWGSNNSVYLDQLFRKQKKAIRIISNAK